MNSPHDEPAEQPPSGESSLSNPSAAPHDDAAGAFSVELQSPVHEDRHEDKEDENVAPDLRTPLRGLDLILLVPFYFISGTALYLLAAAVARYLFRVPPAELQDPTGAKASIIISSQALLSGATLAFLAMLARLRGAKAFWPAVGWRPFRAADSTFAVIGRYLLGGLALAAFTGWVSRFVDRDVAVPMDELFQSRQSVLLLMAMGILVAPLVEETIFRGCVYPILARRFGIGAGVVATGVLFGLVHAPQLWPGFGQIGIMIGVGLVMTYVRARAGTVAASFCVHLGYNSAVLLGYYFATGGLRHLPG